MTQNGEGGGGHAGHEAVTSLGSILAFFVVAVVVF